MVNLDFPKTMEDYVHKIGRTRHVKTSSHATSFLHIKAFFSIAQIRWAITDAKLGNTMAFATGKATRRKERNQVATF